MSKTYFAQVKAIGSSDIYNPRITDKAAVAAAVKAGLVKK